MPQPQPPSSAQGPPVIGWREYLALPDWGVEKVRAKIDTGARTSAVHVDCIEEQPGERVRFHVVLDRRHPPTTTPVETAIVRRTRVRSSTGHQQERIVVATTMLLAGVRKTIEVTLVSRKRMLCRMLIGRTALGSDFLIDAGVDHQAPLPRLARRARAPRRAAGDRRNHPKG